MLESLQAELIALAQVIVIDLVLAGDNAIVVGLAASRVAPEQRSRVIFWGIAAAVGLRIAFAAMTVQLLAVIGLTLAGGILLLWVCWKMYREIAHRSHPVSIGAAAAAGSDERAVGALGFWSAVTQIIVADVSMSLDNVLAVAGAAKGHVWVLVVGLGVAVVLMAVAASYIAQLLTRFPWITWVGLLIILYVALDMMWRGSLEIACAYVPPGVCSQGLLAALGDLVL
jgi:YjbE family integral membrane protein